MGKVEELTERIHRVLEELAHLRKENQKFRTECESLRGHVALVSGENSKAQKILAEYEQLRRRQEQVTHRVERALNTLGSLRSL